MIDNGWTASVEIMLKQKYYGILNPAPGSLQLYQLITYKIYYKFLTTDLQFFDKL